MSHVSVVDADYMMSVEESPVIIIVILLVLYIGLM